MESMDEDFFSLNKEIHIDMIKKIDEYNMLGKIICILSYIPMQLLAFIFCLILSAFCLIVYCGELIYNKIEKYLIK